MLIGEPSRNANTRIHKKYLSGPALSDSRIGPVFAAWDDVTIQITPKAVIAWDMRQADLHVFGGLFKENPTYLLQTSDRIVRGVSAIARLHPFWKPGPSLVPQVRVLVFGR